MNEPKSGPRCAVLGTCTLSPYQYPDPDDFDNLLRDGLELLDAMAREADAQGEALDLVVWPEYFAQGEQKCVAEKAEALDGRIVTAVAERTRKLGTNAAVPLALKEDGEFFNALVFLDRRGEHVGTYRKLHPVLGENDVFEGGVAPGHEARVIELDIGRVGAQICYDVFFDDGWRELSREGAELVVYSSATPALAGLKAYACLHEYYVLSSTWKVPSTVVDPIGAEVARTRAHKDVLVAKVDLDFRVISWLPDDRIRALEDKYGGRIRQDWHNEENQCLLTSLDPSLPVGEFLRLEKILARRSEVARNRAAEARLRLAGDREGENC